MKRYLLAFSILLAVGTACTERVYLSSVPVNNRRTVVQGDTLYTFTLSTGKRLVNTSPTIYYTWYLRNSLASTQGGYEGVLLDGGYTKMLRNNTLLEKGQFRGGVKQGAWTTWQPNGAIQETKHWRQGKQEGARHTYEPDGNLRQSQHYHNGKLHGEEVVYLPFLDSGKKTRHLRTWKEGELTGKFAVYDSLDQLYQEGSYHQGQWDSKIITYEYHGRRGPRQQAVTQVSTYRKGQLHGKFTKRYPDDHIKEQGTYRDGLPYGKITRYERVPSADGQGGETYVKQVYSWKDEQQHGPFAEYYANGKPRRKGKYKAGQLHGKLTTWDQEGEKTVQHYRDGQPVEKQKLTERVKSKLKRKEKPEEGEKVTENVPN